MFFEKPRNCGIVKNIENVFLCRNNRLKLQDCKKSRKCQKSWDNPPPTEEVESDREGFLSLICRENGMQKATVKKKTIWVLACKKRTTLQHCQKCRKFVFHVEKNAENCRIVKNVEHVKSPGTNPPLSVYFLRGGGGCPRTVDIFNIFDHPALSNVKKTESPFFLTLAL